MNKLPDTLRILKEGYNRLTNPNANPKDRDLSFLFAPNVLAKTTNAAFDQLIAGPEAVQAYFAGLAASRRWQDIEYDEASFESVKIPGGHVYTIRATFRSEAMDGAKTNKPVELTMHVDRHGWITQFVSVPVEPS